MNKKTLKKKVTEIYLLKRIKDKAEALIKDRRASIRPSGNDISVDGLDVVFSTVSGRKTFDPRRAASFLREKLSKRHYDAYFTIFSLERRAGADAPPKELMAEMEKYFVLTKIDDVTEEKIQRLPLGIPADELDANCFSRADSYEKMTTPTKVSDEELVEKASRLKLDVGALLIGD